MWFDYLAGQILCILSGYSLSTPTALPRLLMTHHMPGKVALPHAEVCHGCGDPRHLGHIRPLEQAAIKVLQVPAVWQLLIKKTHGGVRTVQRRVDSHTDTVHMREGHSRHTADAQHQWGFSSGCKVRVHVEMFRGYPCTTQGRAGMITLVQHKMTGHSSRTISTTSSPTSLPLKPLTAPLTAPPTSILAHQRTLPLRAPIGPLPHHPVLQLSSPHTHPSRLTTTPIPSEPPQPPSPARKTALVPKPIGPQPRYPAQHPHPTPIVTEATAPLTCSAHKKSHSATQDTTLQRKSQHPLLPLPFLPPLPRPTPTPTHTAWHVFPLPSPPPSPSPLVLPAEPTAPLMHDHLLQKDLSSSLSSPSRTFLGGAWSESCKTRGGGAERSRNTRDSSAQALSVGKQQHLLGVKQTAAPHTVQLCKGL